MDRSAVSAYLVAIVSSALVTGCLSPGGGLVPGGATRADVSAALGPPAMQWTEPDGSTQASFPRGPGGFHSYMAYFDRGGALLRFENVMTEEAFARLSQGMTHDQVLRTIGPPVPAWTTLYPARRETAWEWRYCNVRSMSARYHVLFDADTGRVRSTMSFDESCAEGGCLCAR